MKAVFLTLPAVKLCEPPQIDIFTYAIVKTWVIVQLWGDDLMIYTLSVYRRFPKKRVPTVIMHFDGIFAYKPSILG